MGQQNGLPKMTSIPSAQAKNGHSEPGTFNPKVVGSIPTRPIVKDLEIEGLWLLI